MARLQLLIINPSAHRQVYQGLSNEQAAIEPPIWAAMLANAVRHSGYSTLLLDSDGERMGYSEIADQVKELNPHLVAVVVYGQQPSASTQNMHGARLTIDAIREQVPEARIVIIGGHPSALPGRTLEEENVDFVCQGEGVHTLKGLLDIDLGRDDQLKKVPGLWFKDRDDRVVANGPAPNIDQARLMIELPGPAYDLLPMGRYRAHNWHCYGETVGRAHYASIYTSLGCPFHCSFCCINAPFGERRLRYWPPEFMIDIIDELVEKYGVRHLKIADEMFVLRERHFLELCKRIARRDYQLNIWAYARVDTVKARNLEVLRSAGVRWLGLGIESVSTKVRSDVIKGRFEERRIDDVVKKIQGAGINVAGNFIFGLPEDDHDSMRYNLERAMGMDLEMVNFYSAMAYPGSQLYNEALKSNKALPKRWLGYSQHSRECYPLSTEHLSTGQVLAFRDNAWQAFHTDPRYLKKMGDKFGGEVSESIRKMTEYRLQREHADPKLATPLVFPHFHSDDFTIPA